MRQEYRRMMEQIRLTEEEKERMMEKLEYKKTDQVKPVRMVFLAALVALMVTSVGAVAIRQARVHYFNTLEEAEAAANAAASAAGKSVVAVGAAPAVAEDYSGPVPVNMEERMSYYDTILQHETGGEADGWNEMFQARDDSFKITNYAADSLSALESIWPEGISRPDWSWLEEHYQPSPGCEGYYQMDVLDTGHTRYAIVFGGYQGEDGTMFSLDLTYSPYLSNGDSFIAAPGRTVEQYLTADGAEATISTTSSVTGKQIFDVTFISEHYHFSMYGTQMELDDLHVLLDSLHLSNLGK